MVNNLEESTYYGLDMISLVYAGQETLSDTVSYRETNRIMTIMIIITIQFNFMLRENSFNVFTELSVRM